jgi:hypothetical protein
MERLKIIKELNNVANILEENGRISEASQITNVLIKIAQQAQSGNGSTVQLTQPAPGQPATQNQTQLTPEQIAANKEQAIQSNKNYLNEMLKLRDIAQYFLNRRQPAEYTYDSRGYVLILGNQNPMIGKSIDDLIQQIKQKYPSIEINTPSEPANNKVVDEIAKNIASAADWPDPENDPTITKAINENYLLGYNLLGGTYYIQNKKNPSDVYDNKDINVLKTLFGTLGKFYKDTKKTFPNSLFNYKTNGKKDDGDINEIILEALRQDEGKKWFWINGLYKNHPNFEDIKRGFVQEYKRRNPDSKISMDNPDDTKNA